jgi:transcriptional regulator with XRE-family HTH domain
MEETLGMRLQRARLKRGVSQRMIANHLGISRESIAMIETGKLPHSPLFRLRDIARFLGISLDYLTGLKEEEEVYPSQEQPTALD